MAEYLCYALAGVAGGMLGGMGMGGGTVLIPLLTILLNVPQHTAQAINLISFIPMSAVSLAIHIKNKLVDFKCIMNIIIPGCVAAVIGAFTAKAIGAVVLKRCFGAFLIVLSVFQIYNAFFKNIVDKLKVKKRAATGAKKKAKTVK